MSIRSMRAGDTIIGADMQSTYVVEEKDGDKVRARKTDPPKRLKTFKAEDLECVDLDDGLWQEMLPTKW
jgi:hypothetical protein